MHGADIAQWVATVVVALGLIGTWVSNGRSQGNRFGSLETEVKNIKDSLDDENHGLGAIKKSVDEQKLHCAEVSTALKTRVETLEESKKRRS